MNLPEASRLQLAPDLWICRILNGMWQVSGAHGHIDPRSAVQSMFPYSTQASQPGTWQTIMARRRTLSAHSGANLTSSRGEVALSNLQAFTKWVPRPKRMTRALVEENIAISLRRMDVETLDLLQFHWWDYRDTNYLDALTHLSDLRG